MGSRLLRASSDSRAGGAPRSSDSSGNATLCLSDLQRPLWCKLPQVESRNERRLLGDVASPPYPLIVVPWRL